MAKRGRPRIKKYVIPIEYGWITHKDIARTNPIKLLGQKYHIEEHYIAEIYRMIKTDLRFSTEKYTKLKQVCAHIEMFWKKKLTRRQLRYIVGTIDRHRELLEKLSRGGKIRATYRDLVYRRV